MSRPVNAKACQFPATGTEADGVSTGCLFLNYVTIMSSPGASEKYSEFAITSEPDTGYSYPANTASWDVSMNSVRCDVDLNLDMFCRESNCSDIDKIEETQPTGGRLANHTDLVTVYEKKGHRSSANKLSYH